MNEDDTFAFLKKATFIEMQDEFIRLRALYWGTKNYTDWNEARNGAAEKFGWTIKEYQHENYKRIHKDDVKC